MSPDKDDAAWIDDLENRIRTTTLRQLCAQEGGRQKDKLEMLIQEKERELTEDEIVAREMAEFEARAKKAQEREAKLERLRRATLGS